MKTVSLDVLNAINTGVPCYLELRIDYADGSYEYLSKRNFAINDNNFSDGTGISSFPIGNAHAKQLTVSIINENDRYKEVDFTGAIFTVNACIDIDGVKHEISLGQHFVIEPESYGDIISVTAMDEMYKGDVEYTPGIEFPATIGEMFIDSCQQCGVIAVSDTFANSDYVINESPVGVTHRSLWAWCGLISGGNARMNADNKLEIKSFSWGYEDHVTINSVLNLKSGSDAVVITGVKTTVGDTVYSAGNMGYVLDIATEMPLSDPQGFVDRIASLIIGGAFVPLEATIPANPLIEFGDAMKITDRKGNVIYTIATDVLYSFYGTTSVKCSAENAIRNSSVYNSAAAQAYNKSQVIVNQERQEREKDFAEIYKTANGKNSVFYQGTVPSNAGRKINDIWFDTKGGNKMYYWNGETWEPQQFGTSAIAANSIAAHHIVSEAITAAKIAAGAITSEKIVSGAVTADKIDVNDLFAKDITATGSITGVTLNGTTIYSDKGRIGGFDITEDSLSSYSEYITDTGISVIGIMEFVSGYSSGMKPKISFTGGSPQATHSVFATIEPYGGSLRASGISPFDGIRISATHTLNGADGPEIKLNERYSKVLLNAKSLLVDESKYSENIILNGTTRINDTLFLANNNDDSITANMNVGSDGYMYFNGAARYEFDSTLYVHNSIRFGLDSYTGNTYAISSYWADESQHNIVERNSNGLMAAFGWAGTSSYQTVTRIRGRTCQYQNASGTETLSDERMKKDFASLEKWESFYDRLDPIAFRLKNGSSGRYHTGFKAQQVEEALIESGLTSEDFAGFIRLKYVPDEDDFESVLAYRDAGINPGDDEFGLIYTEFIALNTFKIKKQEERLDALESMLRERGVV